MRDADGRLPIASRSASYQFAPVYMRKFHAAEMLLRATQTVQIQKTINIILLICMWYVRDGREQKKKLLNVK